MKADNEQELLTGLRIMRSHLNVLIDCLEKTSKSYYLDKKGE